jgi:hypothetical protein
LYTRPLEYGAIDIDVITDPTKGTVTDVVDTGSCSYVTSHKETADSFSIQLNTNKFATPYGSTGWVQFVDQKRPGQSDALCVWKVDVTVANNTNNNAGYESTCVFPPEIPGRAFLGPTAIRDVTGHGHVEGLVRVDQNGKNLITVWGANNWDNFNPGVASISTSDTIKGANRGLPGDSKDYSFGFTGGFWTQVTGDIYGEGCGSKAVFTGTKISERLTASTCVDHPACDHEQLSATEFILSRFATPVDDPLVTAESNNLLRDSDFFSLKTAQFSLSHFKCISSDTCKWWGNFHSPD